MGQFLEKVRDGVSMNLVAHRLLTHLYVSDACLHGMGGFSHPGRAWQWYLLEKLRFHISINLLEHMASIIDQWIDIIEENIHAHDCSWDLGDNTTLARWAYRSNVSELYLKGEYIKQEAVQRGVFRHQAGLFIEHEIKNYSQ